MFLLNYLLLKRQWLASQSTLLSMQKHGHPDRNAEARESMKQKWWTLRFLQDILSKTETFKWEHHIYCFVNLRLQDFNHLGISLIDQKTRHDLDGWQLHLRSQLLQLAQLICSSEFDFHLLLQFFLHSLFFLLHVEVDWYSGFTEGLISRLLPRKKKASILYLKCSTFYT